MGMVFSSTRLRALHMKRDSEGDFDLLCQGKTLRAHSFVLATSSAYFEAALSKEWMERNSGRMELKDCSFEALEVAVNFMYHLHIPDGFSENIELLHLADLLMMDDLKGNAAALLAKSLSHANYLETSQAAETYHADDLISECAEFVLEKVVNVNWEEMGKLPKVMAAFGKRVKENKKEDSQALFAKFVRGASVRVCVTLPAIGLFKGDTGVVNCISRTLDVEGKPGKDVVTVGVTGKGSYNLFVSQLELLTFVGPLPAEFYSRA